MEEAGEVVQEITLDGKSGFTPEDFSLVVHNGARVSLSPGLLSDIARVREKLDALIAVGEPMYGITTGVGAKKGEAITSADEINEFQRLLVPSHATGVGDPLPLSIARGLIYLRLISFTRNHSAVSPGLMSRLASMLNHGITPIIPSQGSVGASGDLAPLAHLAACVTGVLHQRDSEGSLAPSDVQPRVIYGGEEMDAAEAWRAAGEDEHFELKAKDALAVINGATLILAEGIQSLIELESLFEHALAAAALSFEAMRAETRALDEKILYARAHISAVEVGKRMRELLKHSELTTEKFRREFAQIVTERSPSPAPPSPDLDAPRIQDAYSFRAIPQVLGASLHAIRHTREVFTVEMGSATDNPLFFESEEEGGRLDVISGANFHGEPLAMVADYLKIAAAEIAGFAERRIAALLDPRHNYGLPADLASEPHLTGLGLLQYTAAALVSENKVLAHPGSVDSIPTGSGQEDHVSMGTVSTRMLRLVVENVRRVIAIEIITGVAGIRAVWRLSDEAGVSRPLLGEGTAKAFERWDEVIGELSPDTYLSAVIERVAGKLGR